jgi:hypothetical protein
MSNPLNKFLTAGYEDSDLLVIGASLKCEAVTHFDCAPRSTGRRCAVDR